MQKYAPDWTIWGPKLKKSLPWQGGQPPSHITLPPLGVLRSLGLGRFAPSQSRNLFRIFLFEMLGGLHKTSYYCTHKMCLPEIKWHSLNGSVLICLVNGFVGTFVLSQCGNVIILLQEVRKHKSCRVFITFMLIFEHCYFVDNCDCRVKSDPTCRQRYF